MLNFIKNAILKWMFKSKEDGLFYDTTRGLYFCSNIFKIKEAIHNSRRYYGGSINNYYKNIGLPTAPLYDSYIFEDGSIVTWPREIANGMKCTCVSYKVIRKDD